MRHSYYLTAEHIVFSLFTELQERSDIARKLVSIDKKDIQRKTFKGANVDLNTTLAYRLLKQKVENILCINYFCERTIKLVQDFGHFQFSSSNWS